MDALLGYLRANEAALVNTIREMVECESPSDEPRALNRFNELLAGQVADIAEVRSFEGGAQGRHLQLEFGLAGEKSGQVMALGHADTVWPMGTLAHMPFRVADGRLWGPGVLDMKAGIAMFVHAMRGLRELDIAVPHRVILQINSDEEVGSPSSRALTEQTARVSKYVMVLEPGTGLTGRLKTARKGVGVFRVAVKGKAAHAGVDFADGASAVVELARQIVRIAEFTDLQLGMTVNPGTIRGGTRSNVIAAEAEVDVDIRIARLGDAEELQNRFATLKPVEPRCSITVTGGLNRPPMERTSQIAAMFARAREIGAALGLELEESATGGGSDGNFTAALGVPTLDGLGAVGEGAHAANESVLLTPLVQRAALLGHLVTHNISSI